MKTFFHFIESFRLSFFLISIPVVVDFTYLELWILCVRGEILTIVAMLSVDSVLHTPYSKVC